ncbi:hypothetical protein ACEZCY_16385 [Streptacidiphilus sp. N1-12]|uniref:Uncharacterized protein n=2 Tax=Streptacidiphilus alkalitolerans TaxID=3342712 RepID=A0ABV6WFH8_9ACTN
MTGHHISHASPQQGRDLVYDPRAGQSALPIQIHYADGTKAESLLILTPDQVELFHLQADRAIAQRTATGGGS